MIVGVGYGVLVYSSSRCIRRCEMGQAWVTRHCNLISEKYQYQYHVFFRVLKSGSIRELLFKYSSARAARTLSDLTEWSIQQKKKKTGHGNEIRFRNSKHRFTFPNPQLIGNIALGLAMQLVNTIIAHCQLKDKQRSSTASNNFAAHISSFSVSPPFTTHPNLPTQYSIS